MTEQEDNQAIVEKLNQLEARYTRIHAAFVAHSTHENWQALQAIGDEYEAEIQKCWDKGSRPIWHNTEGTYTLEYD